MAKDGNNLYSRGYGEYRLFYRGHAVKKERLVSINTTELERCLCKNENGTYNIYEALRYSAYSSHPHADWQRLCFECPGIVTQISLYFLSDEPSTNQQGINLVIELATKLLK
jgi:hypothetical protein